MSTSQRYQERLIDEVKKFPLLYDIKHDQHRDIDARDRCWLEIAERLNTSSDVLKKEWKILRDSMRQAMYRRNQSVSKTGQPTKKWRFQNRMAFLLPYITVRPKREIKHNIKLDETEEPSDAEQTKEPEAWEQGTADHDALELFFASVCQSSKRLPPHYQGILKRNVLDALLRVEQQYQQEQTETKEGKFNDI